MILVLSLCFADRKEKETGTESIKIEWGGRHGEDEEINFKLKISIDTE